MKQFLWLLVVAQSAYATTYNSANTGNFTTASSWSPTTPWPPTGGDTLNVSHAMTFSGSGTMGVGVTYANPLTLNFLAGGSLTGSGDNVTLTINGNITTASAAYVFSTGSGNNLTYVFNGNIDMSQTADSSPGVFKWNGGGGNTARSVTVNGHVTNHHLSIGFGGSSTQPVTLTFNSPLYAATHGNSYWSGSPTTDNTACETSSTSAADSGDSFSVTHCITVNSVTIHGDVVNNYGGSTVTTGKIAVTVEALLNGTLTIYGNILNHGVGWALSVGSSGWSPTVVVRGTQHVLDSAVAGSTKQGGDLFDIINGTLSVYGNASSVDNDVALYCRNGTLNFYGNLTHTPTGVTAPRAVWVETGTLNIYGSVLTTAGYANATPVAGGQVRIEGRSGGGGGALEYGPGTLRVYGDIIDLSVSIGKSTTGTASVLETYGTVRGSAITGDDTGTGNWVSYSPNGLWSGTFPTANKTEKSLGNEVQMRAFAR